MAYVVDNVTPVLKKLSERSRGLALDAIDHIAVVANKAIRTQIAIAGRVDWHQRISNNGKRNIFHKKNVRQAYQRYDKSNNKHLGDMQRFVVNRLYPHSMKAVIGFMDISSFKPYRWRAGTIAGSLKEVKGVNMNTIGQKLEGGGALTGVFKNAKGSYKARPVVKPAMQAIFGRSQEIAQKALDKSIREFKQEVSA